MKQHVARKRFGQNFLVDSGIISDIIRAIDPSGTKPWSRSAPAWGPSPGPCSTG